MVETLTLDDKLVYFFGKDQAEGDASPEMVQLLGNKGAQLQDMVQDGLNVPPGFTVTTQVCQYYDQNGVVPEALANQFWANLTRLEEYTGKKLGDIEADPLLVSARSGGAVSMPGMMETILNVGLTKDCAEAYIKRHCTEESAKFILDNYRRLQQMYGENVHGISKHLFENALETFRKEIGIEDDRLFNSDQLRTLISRFEKIYDDHSVILPQDSREQLWEANLAVDRSATSKTAMAYKKEEGIDPHAPTAVNIQMMVFGNKNSVDCGTGVGFTRNPETGENKPYGSFTMGAQGEDVVNGRYVIADLDKMEHLLPDAYQQLVNSFPLLERHGEIQDFEFTVMDGELYFLQKRNGKRTGRANVRIATEMAGEGLLTEKQAIMKVKPEDLEALLFRQLDYIGIKNAGVELDDITINPELGIGASPGGAVGQLAISMEQALKYRAEGTPYVFARRMTEPSDYQGMIKAQGVFTEKGNKSCHAAVVARNKNIPTAVGTGITIDEENLTVTYTNNAGEEVILREGEFVSMDGATGKVFDYKAETVDPKPDDPDLQKFLAMAAPYTKMKVFANANDGSEAKTALKFGAQGIGLARTEYMFLEDRAEGENRELTIQSWILAENDQIKTSALERLAELQRRDFREMYEVMGSKPIITRLMDYPLHEVLNGADANRTENYNEKARKFAHQLALCEITGQSPEEIQKRIDNLQETNPMLGHRSVRLGITHPELYRTQVREMLSAAQEYNETHSKKGYATPIIEIPLVSMPSEIAFVEQIVAEEAQKLGFTRGGESSKNDNHYKLFVMYELSGAAFNADGLARKTDGGSFGTNDLSQTTYGWSREDGGETFGPKYVELGIIGDDPFTRIDAGGPVAKAMAHTVLLSRSQNADYDLGICGVQAADPDSLDVCYGLGLNNVSPPPNGVPIAILKSAQLSLTQEYGHMLTDYAANTGAMLLQGLQATRRQQKAQ